MEILIPKKTGTYADALCAIGYASLLTELRRASAHIEDLEHSFRVFCPQGRPPEEWQPPSPGFWYILRKSKDNAPGGTKIIDYEREKAIADAAKKSKASALARKRVAEALEEVSETVANEGSPEYRFAAMIESMRKGWSSDLSLYRWIMENREACLEITRLRLQGKEAVLKTEWSNSQLLNPSTGKGVHATKTIAKSASGFKLTDTFDEWMKLRGLWASMLGFRSGEDFKFFVVVPGNISFPQVDKLRNLLRDLGMWGIVRLDIEAVLRLLQSLLLHSEYKEVGGIPLAFQTPADVVRGLHLAFFKSLGTAAALMNDSLLPLPDWFKVEDSDDVEDYLEICQEPFGEGKGTYGPLSTLRDDRSDDVALLQKYRRWLTTGKLMDLLEFHASYASHLLQKIAASDFAVPFQSSILHKLLQKGYPEVIDIIESQGFQNIARAIRNTTIYAAAMKAKSNREIRFGLAQRLKQRIKSGDKEFLAELSNFVQDQNWEVVNRLNGKGFLVSDSDMNDIVRLTAQYGSELVGMLLLAYGYSRGVKTEDKVEEEITTEVNN